MRIVCTSVSNKTFSENSSDVVTILLPVDESWDPHFFTCLHRACSPSMVKYHPADVSVLMTVNEPATLRRDVNEDGFVNVTDVTALVSIILGYNNEHDISTETTFLRGDINEDGFVNVTDVTALVNIILGNKE